MEAAEPWRKLGTLLRAIRRRCEMSQQEVADLLNIDKSYLSLIEHGKRRPGRDLVLMLADRAYALPLGEIDQLLLSAEYAPLRYRHGTDHMPRAVEADTGARPGNT